MTEILDQKATLRTGTELSLCKPQKWQKKENRKLNKQTDNQKEKTASVEFPP